MRVLVGMSGGVDSSVTAALLREQGHDVTGATMKLWGGKSDSGCCSVSEVHDARRVADHLGIEHHVFNYTEAFEAHVVNHYVDAHAQGRTPNPCVECNRHIKFGTFLERALRLGFDAIATGHYARVIRDENRTQLARGVDHAKDQSYVLSVLSAQQLAHVLLPIGELVKSEVRAYAALHDIATAAKADSQDLCFVSSHSREADRAHFLAERITLHPGTVIEQSSGRAIGTIDAVELVTVGQRRGLHRGTDGTRHYALSVDVGSGTVTVGSEAELCVNEVALGTRTWIGEQLAIGTPIEVQTSAHGRAKAAVTSKDGIAFVSPQRAIAPGQVVALYVGDVVAGSGLAI